MDELRAFPKPDGAISGKPPIATPDYAGVAMPFQLAALALESFPPTGRPRSA